MRPALVFLPTLLLGALAGCGADLVAFESDQISGAGRTTLVVV